MTFSEAMWLFCCHEFCMNPFLRFDEFQLIFRNSFRIKIYERTFFMDQSYMKKQPVLGLVLKMSLPMVISMMVNSLYNIVDSLFVAKISENAMTALSLVFPVQNLISAIMIG